jgi:hypothetical protein
MRLILTFACEQALLSRESRSHELSTGGLSLRRSAAFNGLWEEQGIKDDGVHLLVCAVQNPAKTPAGMAQTTSHTLDMVLKIGGTFAVEQCELGRDFM